VEEVNMRDGEDDLGQRDDRISGILDRLFADGLMAVTLMLALLFCWGLVRKVGVSGPVLEASMVADAVESDADDGVWLVGAETTAGLRRSDVPAK
jgi:hypothetical protein